jgi:hypothetical protein
MFGQMSDQMKLNRKYNKMYLKIKEANKRFLSEGKRFYVLEEPFKKGNFFVASHPEFEVIVRKRVNIYDLLQLALYATPERLNQDTIAEVKATNYENVIKGVFKKFGL